MTLIVGDITCRVEKLHALSGASRCEERRGQSEAPRPRMLRTNVGAGLRDDGNPGERVESIQHHPMTYAALTASLSVGSPPASVWTGSLSVQSRLSVRSPRDLKSVSTRNRINAEVRKLGSSKYM